MTPWVVRLLWVLAALCTFGFVLLLYICCVIALPREDRTEQAREKMVLGVCARIDARGDIEVGLARLIALVLLLSTGGAAIIGYIVLHFVLDPSVSKKA
jgi:phage shock protein PspC (stress-responsive transcriptional regulator)